MGNERSAVVFLLGVVTALALIGAHFAIGDERAAEASASGASRHLVVSLGAPLDVSDAGLILADKTELFERAGLRVELRPQPERRRRHRRSRRGARRHRSGEGRELSQSARRRHSCRVVRRGPGREPGDVLRPEFVADSHAVRSRRQADRLCARHGKRDRLRGHAGASVDSAVAIDGSSGAARRGRAARRRRRSGAARRARTRSL